MWRVSDPHRSITEQVLLIPTHLRPGCMQPGSGSQAKSLLGHYFNSLLSQLEFLCVEQMTWETRAAFRWGVTCPPAPLKILDRGWGRVVRHCLKPT